MVDNPDSGAYSSRALAYLQIEEFDKALLDFNKAIEIDKDNFQARLFRPHVLIRKRKLKEAIVDLEHARTINPKNILLNYTLAMAYETNGSTEKAIHLYELTAETLSGSDLGQENIDWLKKRLKQLKMESGADRN